MNATPPDPNDRKNRTGQWEKGTSGNPAGRPRGSRNRASIMMEQLLDGQAEKLVQKVVTSALEGNTHAMAICLDRLIPRCKERTINFDTPPINNHTIFSELPRRFLMELGRAKSHRPRVKS